tara:strand:- start:94252 stop:95016 length:765 start_codon:yes stop_codon:yes gene_type:complete
MSAPRQRLDHALVERGLMPTRARAQSAIRSGDVLVAGEVVSKPARMVGDDDLIELSSSVQRYVSRAALKLVHALDHFNIDVRDKFCLDLGASTGGFVEVLLERHAAHVIAIDVGHGQLVPALAGNPRVTSYEGLNAKDIEPKHLGTKLDIVTCDVSFISLEKATRHLLDLMLETLDLVQENAHLIFLVKPQFEVGKANLGKGGIVRDAALHARTCDNLSSWLRNRGEWEVFDIIESPILGGDGNKEFLMVAVKK